MRTSNVTVFDGVPMDVIAMSFEILFVLQRVLPEARLPNPTTPLAFAPQGNRRTATTDLQPMFCELLFRPSHSLRILAIPSRQRPNRVQMIGQQNDGVHAERPPHQTPAKHTSQQRHGWRFREQPTSLVHDNGEEE
jgi:hypothetical protein